MKKAFALLAVLLPSSLALAHFEDLGNFGWGHHMGTFGWGGGFMMLLFYAVILIVAVSFAKDLFTRRSRAADSAVQILKERYAKGEITYAEYEERRKQVKK